MDPAFSPDERFQPVDDVRIHRRRAGWYGELLPAERWTVRYFHPINKGRNTLAFRLLTSYVHGLRRHGGTVLPEAFFGW